jgi:hypothetical protein
MTFTRKEKGANCVWIACFFLWKIHDKFKKTINYKLTDIILSEDAFKKEKEKKF